MRRRLVLLGLPGFATQPLSGRSPAVCCRCLSSLRVARRQRSSPTPGHSRSRLPPLNASLVPTSPPLPRLPPPPVAADGPVSLRPPHFLKQFYLRVHPDLFHAPVVRVQHTALVTTDDSNDSQQQEQRSAEAITVVTAGVEEVREAEVSSALMREVNETSVARLNELMQYYKQLQALGEATPLVASLPRPPADDAHFAFYCRQSTDTFTYLAHRYTAPQTHTPIVALHAIDAFLTRLLLSAGVAIPASVVQQWSADWAERRRAHKYERVKKHMPWMMDESKRAANDRQLDMMRRDYSQVQLHSTPLTLSQRAEHYMRTMYGAGLVQVAKQLSEEQRMRGTRAFAAVVGKYASQLQLEEWLGSVVRIGSEEEGYGWELGTLRLPYSMTPHRVWKTCREYVRAVQEANAKLESGPVEQPTSEPRPAVNGQAEERERLLSAEWAEGAVERIAEDDPEWQLTAQEVRERRQQQTELDAGKAAADEQLSGGAVVGTARAAQRVRGGTRKRRPKLSPAEWARRLEMQEEAWLESKLAEQQPQQQ